MSLRNTWTESQLRDAIAPALAGDGAEARVRFDKISDAESFRFALYNLRRRKGVAQGYSFILESFVDFEAAADEPQTRFEIVIRRTPVFKLERIVEPVSS